MKLSTVEFLREFKRDGHHILPGTRLLAWQGPRGWCVVFNGAEIPVPDNMVAKLDSSAVVEAAERRASAREEEYQTAKT